MVNSNEHCINHPRQASMAQWVQVLTLSGSLPPKYSYFQLQDLDSLSIHRPKDSVLHSAIDHRTAVVGEDDRVACIFHLAKGTRLGCKTSTVEDSTPPNAGLEGKAFYLVIEYFFIGKKKKKWTNSLCTWPQVDTASFLLLSYISWLWINGLFIHQ